MPLLVRGDSKVDRKVCGAVNVAVMRRLYLAYPHADIETDILMADE